MRGRSIGALGLAVTIAAGTVVALQASRQAGKTPAPAAASKSGWQIPPEAEGTKNPLTVDAKVLATGKGIFKDKCQKCHGPSGRGDGPDADPDAVEDMDLTNPRRAARNPDGVVFFKIWNGRKKPKMEAFSDELTKEQVWAVVAYVQTLRKVATE
jgi:mono/diheme cytochrome c family protein